MVPLAMQSRMSATLRTSLNRPPDARSIHSMCPAIAMATGKAWADLIRSGSGSR